MALPPSTDVNETFLREVDENLRRDRARDFVRANRSTLIGALILFLGASAGLIWWQEYRQHKAGEQVEALSEIYRDIGLNKLGAVTPRLDTLAQSSSPAIEASALFTKAALALEKGDSAAASKIYGQISADSAMPDAYRSAALIRQTALDFDTMKPEDVIARLSPYATSQSPWFGSAAELTGAALIKQGKKAEAGKLFAQVARNKDVPESLRSRSVQIAGSLGVDASDAFPAGSQ